MYVPKYVIWSHFLYLENVCQSIQRLHTSLGVRFWARGRILLHLQDHLPSSGWPGFVQVEQMQVHVKNTLTFWLQVLAVHLPPRDKRDARQKLTAGSGKFATGITRLSLKVSLLHQAPVFPDGCTLFISAVPDMSSFPSRCSVRREQQIAGLFGQWDEQVVSARDELHLSHRVLRLPVTNSTITVNFGIGIYLVPEIIRLVFLCKDRTI